MLPTHGLCSCEEIPQWAYSSTNNESFSSEQLCTRNQRTFSTDLLLRTLSFFYDEIEITVSELQSFAKWKFQGNHEGWHGCLSGDALTGVRCQF